MTEMRGKYTITIDEDPAVCKLISKVTRCNSLPFTSSENLLSRAASYQPTAVFIDVKIVGEQSNLSALPRLRQIWPIEPIIAITLDPAEQLIGEALTLGANDFVRKPLNESELLARFQTRVREYQNLQGHELIQMGHWRFNPRKHYVENDEKRIFLPVFESEILRVILEKQGRVVSRRLLMQALWSDRKVSENALDQRVANLRKLLGEICQEPLIRTVYAEGFCLVTT